MCPWYCDFLLERKRGRIYDYLFLEIRIIIKLNIVNIDWPHQSKTLC